MARRVRTSIVRPQSTSVVQYRPGRPPRTGQMKFRFNAAPVIWWHPVPQE